MKRNFKLFVAVLVLAATVFTITSCSHKHEYSADWSYDETNHWHAAICNKNVNCYSATADNAAHTFVDGTCSVCGYKKAECTHENKSSEETKAASCTSEGEVKYTCPDCGYSYTESVLKADHVSEPLKSVEPTCTETGLSKGEKCSACGEILKAQTTIPSTGHDYDNGVCKICSAEDPNHNAVKGSGAYNDPYILTKTGDYTTDAAGLVFYQYTVPADGYVTLSSNWEGGSTLLKIGEDVYSTVSNSGGQPIKFFALKGTTVFMGVSDIKEEANAVPFTLAFESVSGGSIDAFVGSWKLDVEFWYGTTTYIFNINSDGKGTAVEKAGSSQYNYTLTTVVVNGVAMVTLLSEDDSCSLTFTYNAETDTRTAESSVMGIKGELLPYVETDEPKPEVSYDTVVVLGENILYFSEGEVDANAATRKLNITVAGIYELASANLFISQVVDANGNVLSKNADHSYTFEVGEYTLSFSMFSAFGVSADVACELNVKEVVPGGEEGGGEDETYTEPYDTLKDSLEGEYKFSNYTVLMIYDGFVATYYANVYLYDADENPIYDLYFTYEVTENTDGSYALTLTYASRPNIEVGTEYIDTVLGYEIVIGG